LTSTAVYPKISKAFGLLALIYFEICDSQITGCFEKIFLGLSSNHQRSFQGAGNYVIGTFVHFPETAQGGLQMHLTT
jgi:hypothetical protein